MGGHKKTRASAASSSPVVASSLADRTREIDDIFSNCKDRPTPLSQELPSNASPPKSQPSPVVGASAAGLRKDPSRKASKKRKVASGGDQSIGSSVGKGPIELLSKSRKKTKDGLSVYSEDELGWNRKNAGGTPLCPFDCDCCF